MGVLYGSSINYINPNQLLDNGKLDSIDNLPQLKRGNGGIINLNTQQGSTTPTDNKNSNNVLSASSLISSLNFPKNYASVRYNSGSAGYGAKLTPFIKIKRPRIENTNIDEFVGKPSYFVDVLGNLSGYTEVSSIHLENMGIATTEEIEEIELLLNKGVIL